MKLGNRFWYDWEWASDTLSPLSLASDSGQIIFHPNDLFAEIDDKGWEAADRFCAMALLCPHLQFILWTANPDTAKRYFIGDRAPYIQIEAARIMQVASIAGERPYDPKTQKRMTVTECRAWAAHFGDGWGAACAGISIPHGQPLLSNVSLALKFVSSDIDYHRMLIRDFISVNVAQRFLWLGMNANCEFVMDVWGREYAPLPLDVGKDVMTVKPMAVRKIDWVICAGINTDRIEYHLAQCVETGTPIFIEAARSLPFDLAIQQFFVAAQREPLVTPDSIRAERLPK